MSLNNKVIWITGASSGIGKALALLLGHQGSKLILSARNTERLALLQKELPSAENVVILPFELGDLDALPGVADSALNAFGHVDVLVNNAGISQRSLIAETDMEVYKTLIGVNYLGTVALSKALLPHFI
ncbi:MAG: SDR family NAD(P)-dependent oxidoreductase, partial [Robiginitalea sp.]